MSHTNIYAARADGDVVPERKFQNAYRGAMAVWTAFAERYCHNPNPTSILIDRAAIKQVWELAGNPEIPIADRITLGTTFDHVLVAGDELLDVAASLEHTAAWIGPSHLTEQAAFLRELAAAGDVRAVGWNQTSVIADPLWDIWDEETDSGRPYNLDRDTGHWWLSDAIPFGAGSRPDEETSPR